MAGISTAIHNVAKIMRVILQESIRHPLTTSTLVIRRQYANDISVDVLAAPHSPAPGEREQNQGVTP